MKFEIGDKVWLRDDLEVGETYGRASFIDRMKKGCMATIVGTDRGAYQIENSDYNYTDQMIDHDRTKTIEEEIRDKLDIGDFVKLKDGAVVGSLFTDYPIWLKEVFINPLEVRDYDPYDDTVYLSNDYWYHVDALEKVIITPTVTADNITLDGSVPTLQDVVNSPSHYTSGEIETIDYIQDKLNAIEFEGYCKGNALKYVSRANLKNGDEDIEKAIWYLRFMLGDDPRKDKE